MNALLLAAAIFAGAHDARAAACNPGTGTTAPPIVSGTTIDLTSNCTLGGDWYADYIHVASGVVITVPAFQTATPATGYLNLHANRISIEGTINAELAGFSGGTAGAFQPGGAGAGSQQCTATKTPGGNASGPAASGNGGGPFGGVAGIGDSGALGGHGGTSTCGTDLGAARGNPVAQSNGGPAAPGGYLAAAINGDTTTDPVVFIGSGGGGAGAGGAGAGGGSGGAGAVRCTGSCASAAFGPPGGAGGKGGDGGPGAPGGNGGGAIRLYASARLEIGVSASLLARGGQGRLAIVGIAGVGGGSTDVAGGIGGGPGMNGTDGLDGYLVTTCSGGNLYCQAGGGGGGGGGGASSSAGSGAGGGVLLYCNGMGGITISNGAFVDARGGAPTAGGTPSTGNGGTIKIFYAGRAPDLAGAFGGRIFLQQISVPTATVTVSATATATPTITETITATSTVTATPTVESAGLVSSAHLRFVPNPVAAGSASLSFRLLDEADVTLEIFDYAMDRVRNVTRHWTGGDQSWVVNLAGIPNGVYFVRMTAKAGGRTATATTKLAVVR